MQRESNNKIKAVLLIKRTEEDFKYNSRLLVCKTYKYLNYFSINCLLSWDKYYPDNLFFVF